MENSGQFIKPCRPGSPIKWSTYERERERRRERRWVAYMIGFIRLTGTYYCFVIMLSATNCEGQQDLPNQI